MALDSARRSLKGKGVRLTRQRQILLELIDESGLHLDAEKLFQMAQVRQILLELIDESGLHLDAEKLFQMAQEKDPKLNRVTVYRTLKLLKEGGLVDEL